MNSPNARKSVCAVQIQMLLHYMCVAASLMAVSGRIQFHEFFYFHVPYVHIMDKVLLLFVVD